jgi:hypothetical protein
LSPHEHIDHRSKWLRKAYLKPLWYHCQKGLKIGNITVFIMFLNTEKQSFVLFFWIWQEHILLFMNMQQK